MASITNSRFGSDSRSGIRIFGDPWIFFSALMLIVAGLLALYSVDSARQIGVFKKQVMFVFIGIIPLALFWRMNIEVWRKLANVLYAANLALLLITFAAPKDAKGAGRWIDIGPMQLQPSELSKLCIILTLAAFYANRREEIKELKTFGLSFLHVLPFVILIFKQPHLGATVGVLGIWFMVSIIAGVPWKYIVSLILIGGGTVGTILVVNPSLLLKDYQMDRVKESKDGDSKGRDYQTTQAKIAFGIGGATGSGFMKGEQTRLKFIPEQHNDFVSTVVGEEGGLVACALMLSTFGLLFFRIWLVIARSQDPYCKLVVTGVLTILSFHTLVNLSMNLEIIPVVGLWLPFLSAGGTALWLCVSLVGLALSCSRELDRATF